MHQRVLLSGIRYNLVGKTFRSLFSALLFAIYVVGAIGVDLLHHSIHNHQGSEVHSVLAEKDLCHRTIFQRDAEKGCHHKAHFTSLEKCKFSHVVFQAQQELTRDDKTVPFCECSQVIIIYQLSLATTCLQQTHLRGPPVA